MPITRQRAIAATCGLVAVTVGVALVSPSAVAADGRAHATVKDRNGQTLGEIGLRETAAGVLLRIKLKGLPPGPHGIHVHEAGMCEGDFTSAGPIFNPLGAKHGFHNDEGPMAGDLPNLYVAADGTAQVELLNQFLTVSKDGDDALIDADGAAIVIHALADDYLSEPDGGAGKAIACGVIVAGK